MPVVAEIAILRVSLQLLFVLSYLLAHRYKDDVGFMQGVRRSGHVLCFVFTVVLYASVAMYFSGACQWLNDESHYFKVMIFTV